MELEREKHLTSITIMRTSICTILSGAISSSLPPMRRKVTCYSSTATFTNSYTRI